MPRGRHPMPSVTLTEPPPPSSAQGPTLTRESAHYCVICSVKFVRLGKHVRRVHHYATGSEEYNRVMQASAEEGARIKQAQNQFAQQPCSLQPYIDDFKMYMRSMGQRNKPETIDLHAGRIRKVLSDLVGARPFNPRIFRELLHIGKEGDTVWRFRTAENKGASAIACYCLVWFSSFLTAHQHNAGHSVPLNVKNHRMRSLIQRLKL
jgi:hypothetical protein